MDSKDGTITPTYDGLNRLTQKITPQGTVTIGYDNANRRSSMQVTGRTALGYTYDNANRLTNIAYGSVGATIGYDNANRRTGLTYPNGISATYTYDGASTLTGISYSNGSTSVGTLNYAFDPNSRTLSASGTFSKVTLPQPIPSATYDAANELTQWGSSTRSYDADGNLTADPTRTLTWDARSQMVGVTAPDCTTNSTYDPFGFQSATSSTCNGNTVSLPGGGSILYTATNSLPSDYMSLGNEIIMDADSSGSLNIPLPDGFGQDVALTSGMAGSQPSVNPCSPSLDGGMNCQSPPPPGMPNDNGTTPEPDGVNSVPGGGAQDASAGGVPANSDNPLPTPDPGTSARKPNPEPPTPAPPVSCNLTPLALWDRVGLAGEGAGNALIGLAKFGVGTFGAAAEPETFGASTPLTIYGYVSGAGNFGAAFSDFYGAFVGNIQTARKGSNYSQIITSASGGLTYLATGNVQTSVTAANAEGLFLTGVSVPVGDFAKTADAAIVNTYDLGHTANDFVNPGTDAAPACP